MDWSKVKSAVAGVDGLDVTFEGDDGQLGAVRVPYSRAQGEGIRLPMTPEEFDAKFPKTVPVFDDSVAMTCTDAYLKTYRFVIVRKGYVREVNAVMACPPGQVRLGKRCVFAYTPPFKACSDADALQLLLYTIMDEAYCLRLERLDAKPGYVSTWTPVSSNC